MSTDSRQVLGRLPVDVPDAMVERLEIQAGARPATCAQPAASVVLLRESDQGLQTYLLHRHARMPFAAKMVVFPGGRVDPVDGDDARSAFRHCAIRETREETGVELIDSGLVPWAHWITPAFEPRRYDTAFFLAMLPAGQRARDISGETDRAEWSSAADALAAADLGTLALMPPTRSILLELADLNSWEEAVAAGADRRIETVLPVAERVAGRWRFRYPQPENVTGPVS